MIDCAAIRDKDGKVYSVPRPGRHHDVIHLMATSGVPTPIIGEQGFLTHTGEFVWRTAAKVIAVACGQLLPGASPRPELFTEDMW